MTPLFEDVFARYVEQERIPWGYHTERLRNAMLDDLRGFAADDQWPRGDYQSRMEEKFVFRLDEWLEIAGKIDRLDTAPDGRAYVIDYKYSTAQNTKDKLKDENLLQAPLYLMAAEKYFGVQAAGMFYIGLKGGVEYAGWNEDLPRAGWSARRSRRSKWWRRSARGAWSPRRPIRISAAIASSAMCAGLRRARREALVEGA